MALKRPLFLASILLAVTLLALWAAPVTLDAQSPSTASWQVFGSVDVDNMARGPNRVANAGFESGATGWTGYGSRFQIDSSQAHSGNNSARVDGGALGAALQKVTLNQSHAKPIYVSGWSKSVNGPGGCKMNYSLYFDIVYTDGTVPYAPFVCFTGGTHDWEYVDKIIFPDKPIATIHIWTMLNSTSGNAWFDDLAVGEYVGEMRQFDEAQVIYAVPTVQPWSGSGSVQVVTNDGLNLTMSAMGALPTSLSADGQELLDASALHSGGFYVRDVAAGSDYVHLGGTAIQQGGSVHFSGSDASLGLALEADFLPQGNHIAIDASLRDTSGADRAISLYYALPIAPVGWTWWQDIRTGVAATSLTEHRFALQTEWGANGYMSHYCLSSLSGPAGLAMAYPMDHPVVSRFSYNSATHQYYFVAELGLAAQTQPQPRQADVRLLLYKHDPAWGFRAAFDKYVDIYPQFFEDRVEEEGVWVAHAELDAIPNIDDFHIQFHETGNSRVYLSDDALGIYTLRYLTEPWGYWLNAPSSVDTRDYDQVMAQVNTMLSSTVDNDRRWAQAILSSGIHDANGRYRYEPLSEAFMSHAAAFILDGNPALQVPGYDHTKATQSWSYNRQEPYRHPEWGLLDGEYIDSFESRGTYSDFRAEHFAASSLPLTFDTLNSRPVLPQIFSNYEMAQWIAGDVHDLGHYVMANSALLRWAFPAHLFDIMGSERGWVQNGRFQPDVDNLLNLWRTFSYHKPYAVLQNGDLSSFNHAMVEQYFQYAAFYGIYPSFFTEDGGVSNYWTTPAMYERDRDLHQKYIPIIQDLNAAGWEPVTGATSGHNHIYVERYGAGESFYLTLRNASDYAVNATITINLTDLGLPAYDGFEIREILTAEGLAYTLEGDTLRVPVNVPGKVTRILTVAFSDVEFHQLALSAGWNLVALPGVPYSQEPASLFASLGTLVDRAYGWDADQQRWLLYEPQAPYASRLTQLGAGQGFWLHVSEATTWRVSCLAQHTYDIALKPGWNLFGSPLSSALLAGQVLGPLGTAFELLYGHDPQQNAWQVYGRELLLEDNTLSLIEPGQGYWLLANEASLWTLSDGSAAPPTATPRATATLPPTATPSTTPQPTATALPSVTPQYSATPQATATSTPTPQVLSTNTPLPPNQGVGLTLLADASLNQWAPDSNAGYSPLLMVRQGDICAALLRFDTSSIPPGATIQSAALRLYVDHRTNQGQLTATAYGVKRPWDEFQTDWYQAANGQDWAAAGCNAAADRLLTASGSVLLNNQDAWFSIDVTDLVRAWADGSLENNGLILKGSGSVSVMYEFSSRNEPSAYQRPQLNVLY